MLNKQIDRYIMLHVFLTTVEYESSLGTDIKMPTVSHLSSFLLYFLSFSLYIFSLSFTRKEILAILAEVRFTIVFFVFLLQLRS